MKIQQHTIKKYLRTLIYPAIALLLHTALISNTSAQGRRGGSRTRTTARSRSSSSGRGSIRHSSLRSSSFSTSRTRTRSSTTTSKQRPNQPYASKRQATRPTKGTGYRHKSKSTTTTRPSRRPQGGYRGGKKTHHRYHSRHHRAYYHKKHYKNWNSARRDWYRYRTANHLIAAGTYIATRPRYYSTVIVSGSTYYYWGGTYYRPSGTRYIVVSPPIGAVVYAVPAPTTVVYASSQPYYYIDGTYYVATGQEANLPTESKEDKEGKENNAEPDMIESNEHNYEVVSPPMGATVPYLPENTKKRNIGNKTYYVKNNTFYRAFASDGDTVYMVVANPAEASE